jgi:hypothetical protein
MSSTTAAVHLSKPTQPGSLAESAGRVMLLGRSISASGSLPDTNQSKARPVSTLVTLNMRAVIAQFPRNPTRSAP